MQEKNNKSLAIHELNFIPNSWDSKLAKWVSDILSPPVLSTIGIAAIGVMLNKEINWRVLGTYFSIVLVFPVIYIFYLVFSNQVTDFHLRVRKERKKPFIVMIICASLGALYLTVNNAPYILIVMSVFGIFQIALMAMITVKWKISGHSATVASLSLFIVGIFGSATWFVFLSVPLVAWARVKIKRHTLIQTVGGAVMGFIFMGVMLYFVNSHIVL